jgi:hypothetical protein
LVTICIHGLQFPFSLSVQVPIFVCAIQFVYNLYPFFGRYPYKLYTINCMHNTFLEGTLTICIQLIVYPIQFIIQFSTRCWDTFGTSPVIHQLLCRAIQFVSNIVCTHNNCIPHTINWYTGHLFASKYVCTYNNWYQICMYTQYLLANLLAIYV